MTEFCPVLLLFDLNALINSKILDWLEFARVGQGYVPHVVYQEIQALALEEDNPSSVRQKTPTPSQMAREFRRFFPESEWQLTGVGTAQAHSHLATGQITGQSNRQSYGKRARLALAVEECAYRFARQSVGRMVVLVSNDQALLQRIQALKVPNLTGLPVNAVLLWSRTGRRPTVVSQHLQAMMSHSRQMVSVNSETPLRKVATLSPSRIPSKLPETALRRIPSTASHIKGLYRILSGISTFVTIAITISLIWYIVEPEGFNQLLRDQHLPTIPEILRDEW